tara:strand:+ start:4427 stop:5440 length:1014 start_codon:yes stop_codon:yes gene_type:complete
MKISASIYSNNDRSLEILIKDLDKYNIDMFHVDFNDKKIDIKKVEDDIKKVRKISNKPIDLHIISDNPNKYSQFIIKYEIEFVTYQLENIIEELEFPNSDKTQYGIAITSDTEISEFENFKNYCDFILLMTTTPGESGGKFNKINFKKIRDFKNAYPSKKVHVDGGVNDEIAFILRIHGVKSVVSGSYLVNGDIAKSLLELKSSISSSGIKINEFMLDRNESPIVNDKSKMDEVLSTIEKFDLGFTCVENSKMEFVGIISMADIRKSLIKNIKDFKILKAEDILNKNPIIVKQSDSINNMLKTIQNNNFLISFIPVTNETMKLVGSVTFFNLIKSES